MRQFSLKLRKLRRHLFLERACPLQYEFLERSCDSKMVGYNHYGWLLAVKQCMDEKKFYILRFHLNSKYA